MKPKIIEVQLKSQDIEKEDISKSQPHSRRESSVDRRSSGSQLNIRSNSRPHIAFGRGSPKPTRLEKLEEPDMPLRNSQIIDDKDNLS